MRERGRKLVIADVDPKRTTEEFSEIRPGAREAVKKVAKHGWVSPRDFDAQIPTISGDLQL